MAAAEYRLGDASYKAKMKAAEGDALHKAGKRDESAKTMGITLTHKSK